MIHQKRLCASDNLKYPSFPVQAEYVHSHLQNCPLFNTEVLESTLQTEAYFYQMNHSTPYSHRLSSHFTENYSIFAPTRLL